MKSVLSLVLSLSIITQSFAGTITVTSDQVNARTSLDFKSKTNVVAIVPEGTEGDIVDRVAMPSGNYAIQMKVTKLGFAIASNLKVGDTVWIYYHMTPEDRVANLYDDTKKQVDDPKDGKWARAIRSFQIASRDPASNSKNLAGCPVPDAMGAQKSAVKNQVDCLQKFAAKDVPVVKPSVEEVVAYIKEAGKIDESKKLSPSTQRRVAEAVVKYCKNFDLPTGVPVLPLMLAMMRYESNFDPKAKNSDSGAGGLFQLMPGTARDLAGGKKVNRFDVETNVKLAIKNLKEIVSDYGGNVTNILIGHNAGTGNLNKYLKTGKLPSETKRYIKKVMGYFHGYSDVLAKAGFFSDEETKEEL